MAALGPTLLGWPPGAEWTGGVPRAVEVPGLPQALDTDKNVLVKWPWACVSPRDPGPELAVTPEPLP